MNEKKETQVVGGTGSLQRSPQSQVQEQVENLEAQIKSLEAQEAQLFAARGYGGYIHTAALNGIRDAIQAAKAQLLTAPAQRRDLSLN